MKYATVGSNTIDFRTAMLEVERIIEREGETDRPRVRSPRSKRRLPNTSMYGTMKLTVGTVDSYSPPRE